MRRALPVVLTGFIAIIAMVLGWYAYSQRALPAQVNVTASKQEQLVRFHSPSVGNASARVTIVEFFDPACEACRAFHPAVKEILRAYPEDVRLVLRYAPFHKGSDVVIKLLEAAKVQGKFLPVLDAVLEAQPQWASHTRPNTELAFLAAEKVGLNMERARVDMISPSLSKILEQEIQDITALKVTKTPTFFVNGKPLPSFGEDQLRLLVKQELQNTKK